MLTGPTGHSNGYAYPEQCYSRFVSKYIEIDYSFFFFFHAKDRRLNKPWLSLG